MIHKRDKIFVVKDRLLQESERKHLAILCLGEGERTRARITSFNWIYVVFDLGNVSPVKDWTKSTTSHELAKK